MTIPPGHSQTHTTMLAHEWWVRDARTDARPDSPGRYKISSGSILKKWKVVSDRKRRYRIPLRKCYDLSGHCEFWRQTRQCTQNPNFMAEVCPLTCKLCESDYREDEEEDDDDEEESTSSESQEEQINSGNDEL
jgi:ShK domain-like